MFRLTKIDFYIIKKFLGAFLLTLGLFTVIIIVFDLAEKVDSFIEHKAPFQAVLLDYYINWVPHLLNLFSPVFVFISVIFFTSKMAQKSEIVAILASGVSYVRLLVPYIIAAVFIMFLSFSLHAWIIPAADKNRVQFENNYIRNKASFNTSSIKRQIQPGVIMSLWTFNFYDSSGTRLNLETIENGEIKSKLYADRITWNDEANSWRIHKYRIREFIDGMEIITKGNSLDTFVAFNPEDFFRKNDDVQMFNLKELNEMIRLEEMRGTGTTFFYSTEKYKRYAAPFSIIILTIIGVSVASRKSRRGIGLNLGIGLLISFAFLVILQFFLAYGSSGSMHPLAAVWVPNFMFAGVAYVLYRFAQK